MKDKKLLLRVGIKLMSLVALLFLLYILFAGMAGNDDDAESVTEIHFDISGLKPGDIKYFPVDSREILVLYRTKEMIGRLLQQSSASPRQSLRSATPEYFVAYAYDPVYGCKIKLQQSVLKPVCIDVQYDLSGRVLKNARTDQDLLVPKYEIDDGKILRLLRD